MGFGKILSGTFLTGVYPFKVDLDLEIHSHGKILKLQILKQRKYKYILTKGRFFYK